MGGWIPEPPPASVPLPSGAPTAAPTGTATWPPLSAVGGPGRSPGIEDPPEPEPVVEAGVSTSEWRALVNYSKQLLAAGTVAVVAYVTAKLGLHVNLPPEVLNALVGLEFSGAVAIVGYAISRGVRKANVV